MKEFIKRAFKNIKAHKKAVIGTTIFIAVGVAAFWLGMEIAMDWHAIRTWVNTPNFATFAILIGIGIAIALILFILLMGIKESDKYR